MNKFYLFIYLFLYKDPNVYTFNNDNNVTEPLKIGKSNESPINTLIKNENNNYDYIIICAHITIIHGKLN